MKELELEKIRFANLMSVGNAPVEIVLNKHAKTLTVGKNGAGKSTILEALFFVLYGTAFRDLKKEQLINSTIGKKMMVELWFRFGTDRYHVQRGIKSNVFKIHRMASGDEEYTQLNEAASVKDQQSTLEEILGMNAASFKQIVVLGTAGYTPFMQLKTPERRKLVEDLLDVSLIAAMDKVNKGKLRDLTQSKGVFKMQLEHALQQKATHEAYQRDAAARIEQQRARLEENYRTECAAAKAKRARMDEINAEKDKLILGEDLSENINKYTQAGYKIDAQLTNFSKLHSMHEAGGQCPTCKQDINDPALKADLGAKVGDLSGRKEKVTAALVDMRQKQQGYTEVKNKLTQINQQYNQLSYELKTHVESANRIKEQLSNLSTEVLDKSQEIIKLSEQITTLSQKQGDLVVEMFRRAKVGELLKDSGVKAAVVRKYIPYFNARIAHYLEVMGADFAFTLDEEFNETIRSQGREKFSYNSFSQGERTRIDIALIFTWRDVAAKIAGSSVNALFLDEIFDSAMDADGADAINLILGSLKINSMIISHREHETVHFDRIIRATKVGRFSQYTGL